MEQSVITGFLPSAMTLTPIGCGALVFLGCCRGRGGGSGSAELRNGTVRRDMSGMGPQPHVGHDSVAPAY